MKTLPTGTLSPGVTPTVRPTAQGRASKGGSVQDTLDCPTWLATSSHWPRASNTAAKALRVPMEMLFDVKAPTTPNGLSSR